MTEPPGEPYRIAVVCLGNICRSPTAEVVLRQRIEKAMDAANNADLEDLLPDVGSHARLRMFRSFDPETGDGDDEVPDPWYGGSDGFAQVLRTVERTSDALVAELPDLMAARDADHRG